MTLVGKWRDGTAPDRSRTASADVSEFRARFARSYPQLAYLDLTEPQAFGYRQHIGRMIREEAELAADLLLVRLAPLIGIKMNGL